MWMLMGQQPLRSMQVQNGGTAKTYLWVGNKDGDGETTPVPSRDKAEAIATFFMHGNWGVGVAMDQYQSSINNPP